MPRVLERPAPLQLDTAFWMLRQTNLAESAFDQVAHRSDSSIAPISSSAGGSTRDALRSGVGGAESPGRGAAEDHLIFRLARPCPAPITSHDLDRVRDWDRLLRVASEENAIIALRSCLKGANGSTVPPGLERYVAMIALDREFRMRQLQFRLERALEALNRAGIDVMLLKGGALASTVYGSFIKRPMRDLDILVRPEQADDARALMLDLDWAVDPDLPGDRSYGTHHHLPPLRDVGASGLRLEIHRAILPAGHPFRFTDEELWRAARRVTIGDAHAFVMHPVHHAIHVAIHFAWSHMLKMGGWHAFRDLGTLAAAEMFDWNEFVETALHWRASHCCYWTLRLAQTLADFEAPPSVLERLGPSLPEIIRRPLARHFLNELVPADVACPPPRLDRALWSLAMQPRREGHALVRPWLVSLDLLFALNDSDGDSSEERASFFDRMARSARYISNIIGS